MKSNSLIPGALRNTGPSRFDRADAVMAAGGLTSVTAPETAPAAEAHKASAKRNVVREHVYVMTEERTMLDDALERLENEADYPASRGQLLRAAISLVCAMPPHELKVAIKQLPPMRAGRPRKR